MIIERHLGPEHFAFMRGFVQGLDVVSLWDRYLNIEGESTDARVVKSTLKWIRQSLALLALRQGMPGTARALKLAPETIGPPPDKAPSLQEFIEANDLDDLREAEQIEAYARLWGDNSRRDRARLRIMQRQLDGLRDLQAIAAQRPQAQDRVRAWFAPTIAARLEQHGIMTLYGLACFINQGGRSWWKAIPGIGQGKAGRLVRWLSVQPHAPELSLDAYVTTRGDTVEPRRALEAAAPSRATETPSVPIVPMERLVLAPHLDGSHGAFRARQNVCMIAASTDLQAIASWLAQYEAKPNTHRSYRKEAERLVLWSTVDRGKPISGLTRDDILAYTRFLHDPQPRQTWCAPRSRPRSSAAWRPFEGPLSQSAVAHAVHVISSLFAYLAGQGYLAGNPAESLKGFRHASLKQQFGSRLLTHEQWVRVRGCVPATTLRGRRLALVLDLLYMTGLRISELTNAKFSHLMSLHDEDGIQGWMLAVVGKADKYREVPIPAGPVRTALDLAVLRGASWDGVDPRDCSGHIIGHVAGPLGSAIGNPDAPITTAAIAADIRKLMHQAAEQSSGQDAQRIRKASAHWLRHTHASHTLEAGTPLTTVQANLGHASLGTTSIYVSEAEKKRLKAMRHFWEKMPATAV